MAQVVLGTDNAISTLERGDRTFVPFSFPWFQYLLTIRNMCTVTNNIVNTDSPLCTPLLSEDARGQACVQYSVRCCYMARPDAAFDGALPLLKIVSPS